MPDDTGNSVDNLVALYVRDERLYEDCTTRLRELIQRVLMGRALRIDCTLSLVDGRNLKSFERNFSRARAATHHWMILPISLGSVWSPTLQTT